jgi:hypothetical protein
VFDAAVLPDGWNRGVVIGSRVGSDAMNKVAAALTGHNVTSPMPSELLCCSS